MLLDLVLVGGRVELGFLKKLSVDMVLASLMEEWDEHGRGVVSEGSGLVEL